MAEADARPFSSLRKILYSVAGNLTSEAGGSRPAPTIQSVFGDNPPVKLNEEVYEIHNPGPMPKLEIVFFHGLELGDYHDSYWKNWLCADWSHCWLKTWLVDEFPDARVLSVSFDSSLTRNSTGGWMDLFQITENLEMTLIQYAKVGRKDCPVILVGHSLGGLVMKALCIRANHSVLDHQREFLINLSGLFFYATPHNGSMLSQMLRKSLDGELMAELEVLDFHSARLNYDFSDFLKKYPSIEMRGVGENRATKFGNFSDVVVPEGSARFDRYDQYFTVSADHFGISKPESRTDFGKYGNLVNFIHKVIRKDDNAKLSKVCQQPQRGMHQKPSQHSRQMPQGISTFSFSSDIRYISLKKTEEQVRRALIDTHGSSVILLYGGSGTGKSALVRHVALCVQAEIEKRLDHPASNSWQASNILQTFDNPQASSIDGDVFERVIYMECGPRVTLASKQEELVEQLDTSVSNSQVSYNDDDQKFPSKTTKRLSGLLCQISLLIIMDDVCNEDFLQDMVSLGGKRVKWLITSQRETLCCGLNIINGHRKIAMEEATFTDARRILAVLTTLDESDVQNIPEMQVVMDSIIKRTSANPLALTCVASNISHKRCKDTEQWNDVASELSKALKAEPKIKLHNKSYGRSYWGAIRFCFEQLSECQKNLLILTCLCKGSSASSNVIKYIFQHTISPNSLETFSNAVNELEGKQLLIIKVMDHSIFGKEEIWLLHDQLQEFIEEEHLNPLDDPVSTKFETLAKRKESILSEKKSQEGSILEDRVLITTAFLYFNDHICRVFLDKMPILVNTSCTRNLQRRVVHPIIKLLVKNCDELWMSSLRSSALEVLFKYLKDGTFDEFSTSELLRSPTSKVYMLDALFSSCIEEHHPIIGKQVIDTLFELLKTQTALVIEHPSSHLSTNDISLLTLIAKTFARSLHDNSINQNNATHLPNAFQTVLEGLTSVLFTSDKLKEECCVSALAILASGGIEMKVQMANFPGLLQNLVTAFARDDFPMLQAQAARAICNLSSGRTNLMIVDFPRILHTLVVGLANSENRELQKLSAWALANLAAYGNGDKNNKMTKFPDILQNLVIAMGRDDFPMLQAQAARVVGNLSSGRTRSMIVDLSKVLPALVAGLTDSQNKELQWNSARALANLAAGSDDKTKIKMNDFPGLVQKLVTAKQRDDFPLLQQEGVRAMSNLQNSGRWVFWWEYFIFW